MKSPFRPFFDCRAFVERASELLDGELSPVARFVAEVHLRGCPDCRRLEHQLEATVKTAHKLASETPEGLGEDRKRALLDALRAAKKT